MINVPLANILPKGISFEAYKPAKFDTVIVTHRDGHEAVATILGFNKSKKMVKLTTNKESVNIEKAEHLAASREKDFEIGDLVLIKSTNQIGQILDIDQKIATIEVESQKDLIEEDISNLTSLMLN